MYKKVFIIILAGILFTNGVAFAFFMTPGEPSYSSRYTLADIYSHISSSNDSYPEHTFAPATGPNSTPLTLTDLWNAIPPLKTLIAGDLSSGIFPNGIYSTTTDLTVIDSNLKPENIATGTIMFGITGTCQGIPTDNLISYWSFDDAGAGTAVDVVGGNDGVVIVGATSTLGIKGIPDTAYFFDGQPGTRIELNNINLSDKSVTVSAWVKLNGGKNDWNAIFSDRDDHTIYPFLFITHDSTNNITLFSSDLSPVRFDSTLTRSIGDWHHEVVVFDNSLKEVTFYIDGVADTPQSFSGTVNDMAVHAGIGADYWALNWNNNMNGSIDEVRLYDRTLTPTEIQAIYNIEKP